MLAVDADTLALYRFDEPLAAAGYGTVADSAVFGGTARNLTETGAPSSYSTAFQHIINGPSAARYARWFPGASTTYLSRAGDATGVSTFTGSWTIECWIRIDSTKTHEVFAYTVAGETLATNYLVQFKVLTTGRLSTFWEQGAGANVGADQTTGTALAVGTWAHAAITCDNSGATSTIRFFVGGVLQQTVTGLTKASGGTSALYYVGGSVGTGNDSNFFHGAIKSLRISNIRRADADITAAAALTTYQHAADSNTVALWQFNEAPDLIDETDYGYHARKVAGTVEIVDALATDGGLARHLNAATEYDAHFGYEAFRAMLEGNEWTYDCWFRMDTGYNSGDRGFWVYGDPGTDVQATNFTALDLLSTRVLRVWQEREAGYDNSSTPSRDTVYTTSGVLLNSVSDGYNRHYLAVTKRWTGGVYQFKVYLDGILKYTGSTAQSFDGGTLSYLRIGSGASPTFNPFTGVLDNARWLKRALTDGDILALYLDNVTEDVTSEIALPKLEQRIRIPTGGWAFALTDSNGTGVGKVVPAGDYYLNSVAPGGTVSLCAALAAACTAGAMVYAVTVDDDTDNSTGQVTISANGSFTLIWGDPELRDLFGFEGASAAGPTAVSTEHARALWLPNTQRTPLEPDPVTGEATQDFGRPEHDYIVTTAPSGATTQTVFSRRWSTILDFQTLLGLKTWLSDEAIENESCQRFMMDLMDAGGVPFRYHNNRANDAVYWTLVFDEDAAEFRPEIHTEGWVGARSLWRLQWRVRKYIPLEIGGVWD